MKQLSLAISKRRKMRDWVFVMKLKPSGSKQSHRHGKSKPGTKKPSSKALKNNAGKNVSGSKGKVPATRAGHHHHHHHDEIFEIQEPAPIMPPPQNNDGQELIIYDDHHGHHGHHGHDHIIVQQPQPMQQLQPQGNLFLCDWQYLMKRYVWRTSDK